jgi:protein-S-isoprenylcysteine O-methyltransferase Ste14
MISPTTAASTFWLVWLIGWMLSASWTATTVSRESPGSQISYSVIVWAGAILVFAQPTFLGVLLQPLLPPSVAIRWIGATLVAAGLGFAVWARVHLGKLWSSNVALKEDHQLVRSGPYGIVRHPIYTGLLLALAGTVLTRPTFAALLGFALLIASFVLKLRKEERLMGANFGAAYDTYRADVPGLIPRAW